MLMGSAGFMIGNMVTKGGAGGESKGLTLGWNPTLALVLALVGTLVLTFIVKALIGLRPTEEVEREGLDIHEHGEEGYAA